MNYIEENWDRSEDELFNELAVEYNETAEELQNFMFDNMGDAVDRGAGKSVDAVTLNKFDIQEIIDEFFKINIVDPRLLDINTQNAEIDITNLRSVSKGEFKYNNKIYNYIIKTSHSSDLKNIEIFQLKVDAINIDL